MLLEFHDLVAKEGGLLVVHGGGGGEHLLLKFLQDLRDIHVGAAFADDVRRDLPALEDVAEALLHGAHDGAGVMPCAVL